MPKVEFRNNGILDSLTRAPAPSIFYSFLEREISIKAREDFNISIVTLRLTGISDDRQLMIGHAGLLRTLRKGDTYSRVAISGFWILARAGFDEATQAAKRFCTSIEGAILEDRRNYGSTQEGGIKRFTISALVLTHEKGESFSDFLDRIDSQYF